MLRSMDLSPAGLLSGLILSLVGMGLLIYAKKTQQIAPGIAGVVVGGVPMVIGSIVAQWAVVAACAGGWWCARKWG